MESKEWKFEENPKYPLGVGPWNDEPDKKQWLDKETGLPCLIVRNQMGALCGYVGVSKEHPFYGKSYSDRIKHNNKYELKLGKKSLVSVVCEAGKDDESVSLDLILDVHGGITFSDFCQEGGKICHEVCEGEDDKVWWLGFDTAHLGDLVPNMEYIRKNNPDMSQFRDMGRNDVYRDLEYVQDECTDLAKQLKELE